MWHVLGFLTLSVALWILTSVGKEVVEILFGENLKLIARTVVENVVVPSGKAVREMPTMCALVAREGVRDKSHLFLHVTWVTALYFGMYVMGQVGSSGNPAIEPIISPFVSWLVVVVALLALSLWLAAHRVASGVEAKIGRIVQP